LAERGLALVSTVAMLQKFRSGGGSVGRWITGRIGSDNDDAAIVVEGGKAKSCRGSVRGVPPNPGVDGMRISATTIVLALLVMAGAGCSKGTESAKATPAPGGSKNESKVPEVEARRAATMVTTSSGLQYEILKEGTGASPSATDSVTVHYRGILTNGSEFDSSYKRGQPATFPLNRVIAGWTEGLQLMKEGAKYRFTIPSKLGYGERGMPPQIPSNATLVFEVELIKVNR